LHLFYQSALTPRRLDSGEDIQVKGVLLIALAAALTGCATIGSDVVPIGEDTYQLSMTGVGFATQANTNIRP
jgi:hypothetical protein